MAKSQVTIAISGSYNGAAIAKAQQDLKKLNTNIAAGSKSIGGEFVNAGAKVAQFGGQIYNVGQKMEDVGVKATTGITLPLAAAAAACGKAAIDIDTSLTGVKKTVDGTAEQYGELKQKAIEFSKINAVSATQILDMQALGAQLGFTIDELDEFARVSSGLEIATNMGAEQAATEMARFANITKMGHGEISNYASAIVNLGNSLATTESEVSSMSQRIGAAGTQCKMTQAEVLGWAAAMSSLGVEAEAGGTAFSLTISTIDAAVAKGGKKLDAFAKVAGMSSKDFANSWKNSSTETMQALLSSANGAENLTVALESMGITGVRQSDVFKRLAGNSDLVTKALQTSNQGWRENAALQREVDNRNESMAAKIEMLKNKVIALAEKFGTPLVNAATEFVDAAEPVLKVVENIANAFSAADKGTQKTIVSIIAAAAAFGPLAIASGKVTQGIGSTVVGVGKLLQSLGVLEVRSKAGTNELGAINAKAVKAANGMQGAAKASGALATSLKGIGTGLLISVAVAALGMLADHIIKAKQKTDDLKAATSGLKQSAGLYYSAYASAATASLKSVNTAQSNAVVSLGAIQSQVDSMVARNKELASTLGSIFKEAGANSGMLDTYSTAIEKYVGQTGLTADQVAELQLAVKNVNDVMGTNYTVVKDDEGAYRVLKDGVEVAKKEIQDLIKTQQQQIALNANKQAWEEAYKSLGESAKTSAEALKAYNEAVEEQGRIHLEDYASAEAYGYAVQAAGSKVAQAKTTLDQANATYAAQQNTVDNLKNSQILYQQALDQGQGSIAAAMTSNQLLMATLNSSGVSALGFKGYIEQLGMSQQDLANMTPEQMNKLIAEYQRGGSGVSSQLRQMSTLAKSSGTEAGQGLTSGTASGINAGRPQVYNATVQLSQSAKSGLSSADSTSAGKNFVQGFTSGFNLVNVWNAACNVGRNALNAIKGVLGIHSPSREAMKLGAYFGEGLTIGMQSTHAAIEREAQAMSEAMNISPAGYSNSSRTLSVATLSPGTSASNNTRNNVFNISVNVSGAVANAAQTGQEIGEALYNEFIRRERAFA